MSKLLTEKQLSELPDLYSQENEENPTCYIKLFTPDNIWSWYIMELSKEDKVTCFGYIQESELGYFNLNELEGIRGSLGLAIEVDISFTPTPLSVVKDL